MLDEVLLKELPPTARVLAVGAKRTSRDARVIHAADGALPEGDFDGALVHAERPSAAHLRGLRQRVKPGGLLALAVTKPRGWHRLQQVLGQGESEEARFEALCAAPLLAGLVEPRLVEEGDVTAVLARVPEPLDTLDVHFTQPP